MHGAGFTERVLSPFDDASLLERGLGVTNLVNRTTASAGELSADELRDGARRLADRLAPLRPRFVAVLGIVAYRTGFGRPAASIGSQEERLGEARLWVLPNPSGLNAHYQLDALVQWFRALRQATEASRE